MLKELWREIRGHRTTPRPFEYISHGPEGAEPDIEVEEEAEGDAPVWTGDTITGRTIVITYLDAKGRSSERQVLCRRMDIKGDATYLTAFCFVRERPRSFRSDRILLIVDPETGEIFDPGHVFLDAFMPHSASTSRYRYGLSPNQFADFNAALNVLAFIARCDGEWHPLEAGSIEEFAMAYWLREEIDAPLDLEEVQRHSHRLSPDAESFWVSLTRCAERPKLGGLIREHISRVIYADGVLHEHETFWGSKVDEFLKAG